MRSKKALAIALFLTLICTWLADIYQAQAAQDFADVEIQFVWYRTDKLVASGKVSRTFLWGPEPFTGGLQESYSEAPGGKRLVQYFDKSRMEITNPKGDKTNPFYITNGLLAQELLTGKMQLGDNKFEERAPAAIGLAGDTDDTNGPTYQSLSALTGPTGNATGQAANGGIDRLGNTRDGTADFGKYTVKYAYFEKSTGHNIAQPFWDFLNQTGPVASKYGIVSEGRIFDPVFYATGLPVTEAYWAKVKVAGEVKDVLVQAFERRILTYTPANPAAFQVEMGNVGRHYYQWRYGQR